MHAGTDERDEGARETQRDAERRRESDLYVAFEYSFPLNGPSNLTLYC